jgi:hypothetical protein
VAQAGRLALHYRVYGACASFCRSRRYLLVQNRNGLEPVLDANVSLLLRADASTAEIRAKPTREQAQSKLVYAAPMILLESGKWQLAVTILRNGERTDATGTIEVAPTPAMVASYWGYVAFPPLMIVAFVGHELLLRRRPELKVKRCEIF